MRLVASLSASTVPRWSMTTTASTAASISAWVSRENMARVWNPETGADVRKTPDELRRAANATLLPGMEVSHAMNTSSEDHLRSVRQRLLERGAELNERIDRVRRDLSRVREPLPRDSTDAAIVLENDEVLQAIEQSAAGELRNIERALQRLEVGTCAQCEKCGAEIEAARLAAIPYAMQCQRCARDS